MKLQLGQVVNLYKLKKPGSNEMDMFPLSPGIHEFEEVPNPSGGTGGMPWLVLKSDQLCGMAKVALLNKPGVTEIQEEAPAEGK